MEKLTFFELHKRWYFWYNFNIVTESNFISINPYYNVFLMIVSRIYVKKKIYLLTYFRLLFFFKITYYEHVLNNLSKFLLYNFSKTNALGSNYFFVSDKFDWVYTRVYLSLMSYSNTVYTGMYKKLPLVFAMTMTSAIPLL